MSVSSATKPLTGVTAAVPVLELREITMEFGTQRVLQEITISVRRGETLVLIGESGCGKSVTTKLLAGLLEPTRGEVCWDGRPVQNRSARELRRDRLRFGYLFQGAALFDSLNVYENVAFGLRENTELKESQIRDVVLERLREVGLSPTVSDKRPSDLSGGMKKRVGLARALAMSPDVVFYDEPTTGLDPVMSDVINELILQTQARRKVTSVVVTHDMNTVRRVADRVVMLYPLSRIMAGEPQLIFEGSPEAAFENPDLRVTSFVRGEAGERLKEMYAA
ncbi:MAG: ATP-binding cassette domain-containing protein [Planctomycetes bacterium]|nr:ATP-binding cassette domain-containing protein [Planctomycetota bacterium]